jgi:hypothetical protein
MFPAYCLFDGVFNAGMQYKDRAAAHLLELVIIGHLVCFSNFLSDTGNSGRPIFYSPANSFFPAHLHYL